MRRRLWDAKVEVWVQMPDTLNITVVEDDDDAREALVDILELDRHRVTAFSTAELAVASTGFASAEVVLLDRQLPDGLAEELVPQMKKVAPSAEFIVITRHADMNAAIAAMREGVTDYLIKPIDPEAMRTTLVRLARRRSVEGELDRERRFSDELLNIAEAIVLVLDPNGRVRRCNRYLLELTGYSASEVLGADWFQLFIPERDQVRMRDVFEHTVNQIKTRGIVNPILTSDERECEIRWSNSTLRDADGKTTGVLSVGLDVTDLVMAQKKSLQNERLVTIGATMTGLAHESRNALQRWQNAVELLQGQIADRPQALKDLAKIERAGNHIRDLLEEVRAYAAPIVLSLANRSLPVIWRRAWDSVAHHVEDRKAVFKEILTASHGGVDDVIARIDERRVEQLFRNLFENAIDAGAGPLHIEVECRLQKDSICVQVRDNGPGVPVSHRGNLFDAFATSKSTGTGLGLAICRRVVEAHGGTIRLVPSQTGAHFEFTLPRSSDKS